MSEKPQTGPGFSNRLVIGIGIDLSHQCPNQQSVSHTPHTQRSGMHAGGI